jgi:hypothetical protein
MRWRRWQAGSVGTPLTSGTHMICESVRWTPPRKHPEVDGEVERGGGRAPALLQLHDAEVVLDGSMERETSLPIAPVLEDWPQLIGHKLLQRVLLRHVSLPFQVPLGS